MLAITGRMSHPWRQLCLSTMTEIFSGNKIRKMLCIDRYVAEEEKTNFFKMRLQTLSWDEYDIQYLYTMQLVLKLLEASRPSLTLGFLKSDGENGDPVRL